MSNALAKSKKPQYGAPKTVAHELSGAYIEWEGLRLPPRLRSKDVETIFRIKKGTLYSWLNSGRVASDETRLPKQRRGTGLIHTRSLIAALSGGDSE